MAIAGILLDGQPAYLQGGGGPHSLLLSPLGSGTLLAFLRAQVLAADAHVLAVMPRFGCDEAYRRAARAAAPDAEVVAPETLRDFLLAQEPGDRLLIVDARHMPLADAALPEFARENGSPQLSRFLVRWQHSAMGLRERVLCDGQRRIRAIQRVYDGVTRVDTVSVSAALVSVAAARELDAEDLLCLSRLRSRLAALGVPGYDLPGSGQSLDLSQEEALIAWNERLLFGAESSDFGPPFVEYAPRIWKAPGCRVHASCRLYGPIILHENVTVEAHAVIVGPAVLGVGAHVEPQAVVSQSVLMPRARVPRGGGVVRRVVLAAAGKDATDAARPGRALSISAAEQPPLLGPDSVHTEADLRSRGRRLYTMMKYVFDFQAALFGLLLLSPLLIIVAVLIKLTSRGPIFFGHEREGLHGKVFRCWKFRTMVDGAHRQQRALYRDNLVDGPQFKLPEDRRVTRVGRWLRDTNIDELPQLFNVLRGDMSLVGPRPSPFRENQICVPWRRARLSVRPGITGLWQICRYDRAAGDFQQWIYFDMLYVRHMSLGLDLRVLLATVLTLGGRSSVPVTWMIPRSRLRAVRAELPLPATASKLPETADVGMDVSMN